MQEYSFRIWNLDLVRCPVMSHVRGEGRASQYLPEQLADGTDRDASIFPTGSQLLEREPTDHGTVSKASRRPRGSMTCPLLPRVSHVLFGLEQGSDIYGLSTP